MYARCPHETALRNAELQADFPSDVSVKATGLEEHVQHVELKPGQRHTTYFSHVQVRFRVEESVVHVPKELGDLS